MNPLLILGLGVALLFLYSGSAAAAQLIQVKPGETWALSVKFTGLPIDTANLDLLKSEYASRGIEVQSLSIDAPNNTLNATLTFIVPDQIALGHFVEMVPGKGYTITSANRVGGGPPLGRVLV